MGLWSALFRKRPKPTIPLPEGGVGWAQSALFGTPAAEGRPPPVAEPRAEPVVLVPVNRDGSVEHFYHFVLGFLAPLLSYIETAPAGTVFQVRSCGPMDDHLRALAIAGLDILDGEAFREALRASGPAAPRLPGFDGPEFYDADVFARVRAAVLHRLEIPQADGAPRETVIVDRGESPAFYQSDNAESKTSANLRRSIPNMAELDAALDREAIPHRLVALERTPFREQVALFARTGLICAQHGAALVHMLWMPPGGTVVEIRPLVTAHSRFAAHFRALAACCGHTYAVVDQHGPHAPVDVDAAVRAIRAGRVSLDASAGWPGGSAGRCR